MNWDTVYNQYWENWHKSERKFYKLFQPSESEILLSRLGSRLESANKIKDEGNSYFKAQDYKKAAELYLSAIETVPEAEYSVFLIEDYLKFKLAIMTNLSMCFLKNKQFKLSILQCTEGLKQFPRNVKLRYILGSALGEDGNYEEALEVLKIAKDLDPSNKEIREKIQVYHSALSEYKKKIKEMFGGKLKQDEPKPQPPVPELKEDPEVEKKDQKGDSWFPYLLVGAVALSFGYFFIKKHYK